MPGRMRSRNSTTVTRAPRRRHTDPSSSPMMPAPTTTMVLGTDLSDSAPVELTIRFSSMSTPRSGATSEPVAMTMLPAFNRCFFLPSVTVTWPAAVIAPTPTSRVTLFFLSRNATPLVRSATTWVFRVIMVPRSSVTAPVFTPWAAKVCAASSKW